MFKDRKEAGELLAQKLSQYRGKDAVVYALPRGGVVLGFEIAKYLRVSLDLVIARKIGHPENPEYAICATTEDGEIFFGDTGGEVIDPAWLDREIEKGREEAKRRRQTYLKGMKHIGAKNKIAIVVDDGVATGLTLRVALRSLRHEEPKELVVAVPVAPHEMVNKLRAEADQVVVLQDERSYLGAVGAYYENFPQVSDSEVISLMQSSRHGNFT